THRDDSHSGWGNVEVAVNVFERKRVRSGPIQDLGVFSLSRRPPIHGLGGCLVGTQGARKHLKTEPTIPRIRLGVDGTAAKGYFLTPRDVQSLRWVGRSPV